jgi:hypothetical protein
LGEAVKRNIYKNGIKGDAIRTVVKGKAAKRSDNKHIEHRRRKSAVEKGWKKASRQRWNRRQEYQNSRKRQSREE